MLRSIVMLGWHCSSPVETIPTIILQRPANVLELMFPFSATAVSSWPNEQKGDFHGAGNIAHLLPEGHFGAFARFRSLRPRIS
jgi:hypothetical protein